MNIDVKFREYRQKLKLHFFDGSSVVTEQPQLFEPIINGGLNKISWANNPSNGDFPVSISATVNGISVSSPLTITDELDGKTLHLSAEADKFKSATMDVTLSKMQHDNTLFAFDNYSIDSNAPYNSICITAGASKIFDNDSMVFNDVTYNFGSGYYIPCDFTKNTDFKLQFIAKKKHDQTTNQCFVFYFTKNQGAQTLRPYYSSQGVTGTTLKIIYAISCYVNGELVNTTISDQSFLFYASCIVPVVVNTGDLITFVCNIHFV